MESIEDYRKYDAKQYWTKPHLIRILIDYWWLSEHHLNEIPDYDIPTIRQMYYRLSWLTDNERELLKKQYYVPGKQVTYDDECAEKLGITKKEFRLKRVAILTKLQEYRISPSSNFNISRDELYRKIEAMYGDILR